MQNRIRQLRKERGLTQRELAGMVNSSGQQICHLENGGRRLTVGWLEKLATALKCHPLELLTEQGLAKTDDEKKLLTLFRALGSTEQSMILEVALRIRRRPRLGWNRGLMRRFK